MKEEAIGQVLKGFCAGNNDAGLAACNSYPFKNRGKSVTNFQLCYFYR